MRNYPFVQSQVWAELSPRHRQRVLDAVERTPQKWVCVMAPAIVEAATIRDFASRNLLRGFLDPRSRGVITAVSARPLSGGTRIRIGFSPHPLRVPLPCWGCSFATAMKITFGKTVVIRAETGAESTGK